MQYKRAALCDFEKIIATLWFIAYLQVGLLGPVGGTALNMIPVTNKSPIINTSKKCKLNIVTKLGFIEL